SGSASTGDASHRSGAAEGTERGCAVARESVQEHAGATASQVTHRSKSGPPQDGPRLETDASSRRRSGSNVHVTSIFADPEKPLGPGLRRGDESLLGGRGLLARGRHELVEVLLGDAEPKNVLAAALFPRLIHLLEARIRRRKLVVHLARSLPGCLHDFT